MNHIKKDYSQEIENFVKSGGVISQAINTNKTEFNGFNADAAAIDAAKPTSQRNLDAKEAAAKVGQKSYVTVAPCDSCLTSERSVRSNACLECDRRRARAKTTVNTKNLEAIGHYLLLKNEVVEFTSGGKKYVLKVEVA